ncbi:MAG: hypothetical protein AAGD43_36010 [Pseudomonadota bacterium]
MGQRRRNRLAQDFAPIRNRPLHCPQIPEDQEKDAGRDGQAAVHRLDGHSDPELGEDTGRETRKPSVNERLEDVLNKPREKLEIEDDREQKKDQEVEKENEREIDTDVDRDPGLSH